MDDTEHEFRGDEEASPATTEEAVIEAVIDNQADFSVAISELREIVQSLSDRMNLLESDASNDDGNGNGSNNTPDDVPVSPGNTEAETGAPNTSGDGSVTKPNRVHPYYRKIF